MYLEPTTLGWRPIVKSWIDAFGEVMQRESSEVLNDMFEWLVDPCLDFVRKNTKVGRRNSSVIRRFLVWLQKCFFWERKHIMMW